MLASLLAVTLLAGPTPEVRCVYLVRHAESVRVQPRQDARLVDRVSEGDRVMGSCKPLGRHHRWHAVVGTRKGKQGFVPLHTLDRLGTFRSLID